MRLPLHQILTLLVSFLGLIVGAFLIFRTLEEYKPGKEGFKWLKRIILLVLIIIFLSYAESWIILIGIIIGFLIAIFVGEYLFLGLAMLLSFLLSKEFSLLIASLLFILGLTYGR